MSRARRYRVVDFDAPDGLEIGDTFPVTGIARVSFTTRIPGQQRTSFELQLELSARHDRNEENQE